VDESMFDNTHRVAQSINDGVREARLGPDVDCVPVGDASTELIKSTNLLVVGGPTHIRGMTSGRVMPQAAGMNSRQSAASPITAVVSAAVTIEGLFCSREIAVRVLACVLGHGCRGGRVWRIIRIHSPRPSAAGSFVVAGAPICRSDQRVVPASPLAVLTTPPGRASSAIVLTSAANAFGVARRWAMRSRARTEMKHIP
jgi:hypothetical protein